MRANEPSEPEQPAATEGAEGAPVDPAAPAPSLPSPPPPDAEPDMDAIREAINELERRANADRFRSMGW